MFSRDSLHGTAVAVNHTLDAREFSSALDETVCTASRLARTGLAGLQALERRHVGALSRPKGVPILIWFPGPFTASSPVVVEVGCPPCRCRHEMRRVRPGPSSSSRSIARSCKDMGLISCGPLGLRQNEHTSATPFVERSRPPIVTWTLGVGQRAFEGLSLFVARGGC